MTSPAGDQGFLNEYYSNFINAPLYDPEFANHADEEPAHRLPTRFNGDVGLYVLNSNKVRGLTNQGSVSCEFF